MPFTPEQQTSLIEARKLGPGGPYSQLRDQYLAENKSVQAEKPGGQSSPSTALPSSQSPAIPSGQTLDTKPVIWNPIEQKYVELTGQPPEGSIESSPGVYTQPKDSKAYFAKSGNEQSDKPTGTNISSANWDAMTPEQRQQTLVQSAGPVIVHNTLDAKLTAADQQRLASVRSQGPAAYESELERIYLDKGLTKAEVDKARDEQRKELKSYYQEQLKIAEEKRLSDAGDYYDEQEKLAKDQGTTLTISREEYLAQVQAEPALTMTEGQYVRESMSGYNPQFEQRTVYDTDQVRAASKIEEAGGLVAAIRDGLYAQEALDAGYSPSDFYEAKSIADAITRLEEIPGAKAENGSYNLTAALQGITNESDRTAVENDIRVVFGEYALTDARNRVEAINKIEEAGGLVAAIRDGLYAQEALDAGYSPSDFYEAKDFAENNIEIAPDKWIDKEWYNSLKPEEQNDVKTAYNTPIPDQVSFAYNPENKRLTQSYDTIATADSSIVPDLTKDQALALMYSPNEEAEKVFLQASQKDQKSYITGLLDKPATYESLTPAEKTKVIDEWKTYVNSIYNPMRLTGRDYLKMVPVVGTVLEVQDRGWKSGWTIASAIGDAFIIVPAIKGVSVAVKGGQSIGRAVVSEGVAVARGEIMGTMEMLADPVGMIKSTAGTFASFVPFSKNLPLASLFRGSYAKNMSISKIEIGEANPLSVRDAMERAERAMISGSKSGKVDIEGGGVLHYSSSGVQSELPGTVVSSTPYGRAFQGTGLTAEGEGVWNAPSAYLGLEKASASGKSVVYGFKGKDYLGIIQGDKLIGEHGRAIGYVKDSDMVDGAAKAGAKIYSSETGSVIGKTKTQPAFVLIHTNGMQQLPDWAKNADTIGELESRAWKEFGTGEYANDLYPVFKQYSKWIEEEGLLPKGTRLIPVLDNKGRPVIMRTHGAAGESIAIPYMQIVDKNWLSTARAATEELKPIMDMLTPKMSVEKMLSKVTDIPQGKKSASVIADWFRANPDARLVGSTVEYMHTGKHVPHDIDMGAPNPAKAAEDLAKKIQDATGQEIKVHVSDDGSSRLSWVDKKGNTVEMANIKATGDYPTRVVDGVRMETPAAQLERTLKRMEDAFDGKGYMRFERFIRSAGHEVDLGIGAKPPTWQQIEKLRIKGWKNTITDIFNKDLRIERRMEAAESISPNVADDVADLASDEKALTSIQKETAEMIRADRQRRAAEATRGAEKVTERAAGTVATIKGSAKAAERIRENEAEISRLTSRINAREAGLRERIDYYEEMDKTVFDSIRRFQESAPVESQPLRAIRSAGDAAHRFPGKAGADRRKIESDTAEDASRAGKTGRSKTVETPRRPVPGREESPDRQLIPRVDRTDTTRPLPGKTEAPHRRGSAGNEDDTRVTEPRADTTDEPPRRPLPGKAAHPERSKPPDPERSKPPDPDRIPPPDDQGKTVMENEKGPRIKEVEGIPANPGTVHYQRGEVGTPGNRKPVWISVKLAWGTEGRGSGGVRVSFEPPPDAPRKRGTPQETLFVSGGKPPKKLVVGVGAFNDTIQRGRIITSNRETRNGGVTYRRSKRGIVIEKERAVMTTAKRKRKRA